MAPIGFLSDFGLADSYVSVIKAVIYQIDDNIKIIDISHEIAPQDVKSAMYVLSTAFDYFPAGTVFMAVIDPEVGTSRLPVVLQIGNKYVVCPNNGIASLVAHDHELTKAWEIKIQFLTKEPVSKTFQGRDVFAPAAAMLSKSQNPDLLGIPMELDLVVIDRFQPAEELSESVFEAGILHIDRFGNIITSLKSNRIESYKKEEARFIINGFEISGIKETYADVEVGEMLAYVGSSRYLEIGIRNGNAAQKLIPDGIDIKITVRFND